jgi:D-alanyl-lipoteichoic acid acyltransferase DltB (MBOAT superfamily)
MLFNSLVFAIFFAIVYPLYLSLGHRWQNRLLLVASYLFYGWWDWRFLSLILLSTAIDYFSGLRIDRSPSRTTRKFFLFLSVLCNLSILGFFKYFNFFATSFQLLAERFGVFVDWRFMNIVLPVGISFYTFQSMGYSISIYRGEVKSCSSFLDFALFVAFFPQLVAGPIERATHLLPQIRSSRKVSTGDISKGAWLIFWGLFQKMYIADNLARLVDPVYSADSVAGGGLILVATYAYAFQILCDFAGYSNIARGLGKCMGFDIMSNFKIPYSSANPGEFWRRWHISLSRWLRDYLYISMGGNRKGSFRTTCNIMVTMVLGGLWHGAAWHFVLWGAYHGILILAHRLLSCLSGEHRRRMVKSLFGDARYVASAAHGLKVVLFFHLTCLGWVLFRAQSAEQAYSLVRTVVTHPSFDLTVKLSWAKMLWLIAPLIVFNAIEYRKRDEFAVLKLHPLLKGIIWAALLLLLLFFGPGKGEKFIYFQF